MPQVIVGAAISAAISTAVTYGISGFTWALFSKAFVTHLVLGGLSRALAKKPSGKIGAGGQTVSSRSPIAPHQIIYGRTRVGGTIVHMEATNDNKYLHLVIAVAGHEIDAFEKVYFDDAEVTLDGSGFGYSGKARVKFGLGTPTQTAFSDLVSESGAGWSNNHRLQGVACAYVRLEYDQDKFPNGLPNISFLVRGKKVYDPRSSQTVWSSNPALCVNDYLTNTTYGLGCTYANEINETTLIAAANVCDEDVALDAGGTENRYECHGIIATSQTPADAINALLGAMAGKAIFSGGKWRILAGVYYTPTLTFDEDDLRGGFKVQSLVSRRENFNCIKGVFSSIADQYVATDFPPVISSTFIAQDNGEAVYKSIELPLTTSPSMAQRLAKIELLKARQQITLTMPLKLSGLQANVGDIVQINNTRMGWSAKPFEVVTMQMALGEQLGVDLELREISTDVFDWQTSEEQAYDPSPNTNLPNAFVVATPTDLTIQASVRLTADGTAQSGLLITWTPPTNAFVLTYEVQWIRGSSNVDWGSITTAADDTLQFGTITTSATSEIDYGIITEAAATEELGYNSTFVTQPYHFIAQAFSGVEYAVRVRAINALGVRSAWVTDNYTTYGDTDAPAAPDGLTATGGYRQITLKWTNPAVSDFDYSEIYRNTTNNSAGATRIGTIRGNTYIDQPLDINVTRYYWLKSVDRSGNVSGFSTGASATTEFVDSDSFTQEVMNLFAEAGAYGIEPVATLPTTGDFDGQIKYDTTNNKLWRWDATGGVWSDDIFSITSGSVDAASFAAGIEPVAIESSLPNPSGYTGPQVVFLTSDNKLYRYTGSAWTTAVATTDLSGTLAASSFANDLRPVEVVGALPSTGNFAGRVVVLTTDSKLYRYTGSAWTAAVNTTDLSGTIADAQIAALGAAKITGQLTDSQLQELSTAKLTGTISETQITDGAISTAKLAAGSITTAKIAAGAVTADEIGANAITSGKIQAGAVETAALAAGSVSTAKLAADSVTADKVAASAIETDAISANAITTAKIAAGAVTSDILAANSVVAGKIAAAAISATALQANIITSTHIAASTIQGDRIAANTITGGLIAASGIITNSAQIDDSVITNAKIANAAITTAKINDAAITSAKIDSTIESTNFVTNTSGWQIKKDGSAEFNGVVISRQLEIDSGDYVFGSIGDNNSNTLDALTTFFIETNTPSSAWTGSKETYMALVGRKSGSGYGSVSALTSNVTGQPQNIQWGWGAEVVPITRWSGNQRLWIKVTLYTRLVDNLSNFTLTWRLIEVT